MRKTVLLVSKTPLSNQQIINRLRPLGKNFLNASIVTKHGENDMLIIHYDDDNGRISDDYIRNLF